MGRTTYHHHTGVGGIIVGSQVGRPRGGKKDEGDARVAETGAEQAEPRQAGVPTTRQPPTGNNKRRYIIMQETIHTFATFGWVIGVDASRDPAAWGCTLGSGSTYPHGLRMSRNSASDASAASPYLHGL